ncbi:hypothetical protein FO519_006249 [Halicephalobus sp. NKZ332]|nr:hypothetical protein FO519_006249 [Halicephalobus sp. NKZ332]
MKTQEKSQRRRRHEVSSNFKNNYDLRPTAWRMQRQNRVPPPPQPPSATQVLRNYDILTYSYWEIGSGHYSKVYRAIHNDIQYAVKVIKLKQVGEEFRNQFLPREITCWHSVKHENICRLMGHFSYEDIYMFMIMEYCNGGDLLSFIQENGPLPDLTGRTWLGQLLDAVIYLHRKKIAHRDIKAENVLISPRGVKLTDFGFACYEPEGRYSTTYCGSKAYSCPEVLGGIPYDVFKGDVWSFGTLCYVAMTNSMPFRENVSSNKLIIEQQRRKDFKWSSFIKPDCKFAINRMLTFDQEARPNAKMVRDFSFFCGSNFKTDLYNPQKPVVIDFGPEYPSRAYG